MPIKRPPAARTYTVEERVALATAIARRYDSGEGSIRAIALTLGTTESNYYNWRRAGLVREAAVAEPAPAPPAARRFYTEAEREALLAKVDELRAGGRNMEAACRALGIADSSYRKWKAAGAPLPTMRPVEVRALVPVPMPTALALAPPRPAGEPVALAGLVLVAPGGYRVEGLGVEAAAALLRALA